MATRSSIAVLNDDGTVTAIYCHWDGYIEHNGRVLINHWNSNELVVELITLGDLSSLGNELGVKHEFANPHAYGSELHTAWDRRYNHCNTYYGRDRGDRNCEPRHYDNIEQWLDSEAQEFHYLWTGQEWLVNRYCDRDHHRGHLIFDRVGDLLEADAEKNQG